MISYIVQPGDSLWKIARSYHITLDELIAANPQIQDPNQIQSGETIYIPKVHPSVPDIIPYPTPKESVLDTTKRPCIYIAHDGETLESISHSFMVPLSRMLYYNLRYSRNESLKEGVRIILPEYEIQPVTPRRSKQKSPTFIERK